MPEIDLTISISVILAVCAIISPIATTLINNRYQLKLKDLEYQQKEKESSFFYRRGVYEDYLRCTGKCIAHPTRENIQEYGKIYALALIYFPENLIADLESLHTEIYEERWDSANSGLNKIAPKIRAILRSM